MSNKRLKNIYRCMKQRCYNPHHSAARWYHDKGIRICQEWLDSFTAFEMWAIENGYSDDLTIDRIDPNGDYEPANCRWLTMEENRQRAIHNKGPRSPRTSKSKSRTVGLSEANERIRTEVSKHEKLELILTLDREEAEFSRLLHLYNTGYKSKSLYCQLMGKAYLLGMLAECNLSTKGDL